MSQRRSQYGYLEHTKATTQARQVLPNRQRTSLSKILDREKQITIQTLLALGGLAVFIVAALYCVYAFVP